MNNLDVHQVCAVHCNRLQQPKPKLLTFDALVLKIQLELPSTCMLWYRQSYKNERQFIVASLIFTGLPRSYADGQNDTHTYTHTHTQDDYWDSIHWQSVSTRNAPIQNGGWAYQWSGHYQWIHKKWRSKGDYSVNQNLLPPLVSCQLLPLCQTSAAVALFEVTSQY